MPAEKNGLSFTEAVEREGMQTELGQSNTLLMNRSNAIVFALLQYVKSAHRKH